MFHRNSLHRPRGLSVSSEDSTSFSCPEEAYAKMAARDCKASAVDESPYSRRQSSACSERSCEGMSNDETRELWLCMLELQGKYGCYNSTRIDLAMSSLDDPTALMRKSTSRDYRAEKVQGLIVSLLANRFIIDTLNDSLWDLPQAGWEMLDRCLRHEDLSVKHNLQQGSN